MTVWLVWLIREEVIIHDFSTDEALKWEGGKHVETEAEAGDLNHQMSLGGKVIEHITLGLISKGKEASKRDNQASYAGDGCAVVGNSTEAIHGGSLERAVDQKGVVMADEC